MCEWTIIAYEEPEEGLRRQEVLVIADSPQDAYRIAWKLFPEYHEVGIYRKEE